METTRKDNILCLILHKRTLPTQIGIDFTGPLPDTEMTTLFYVEMKMKQFHH